MKSLIVANWKMNPKTFKEAKKLFDETKRLTGLLKGVSVVVCPPAVFLRDVAAGRRKGRVSFGAQNVHFEAQGSYTGEISVAQVKDVKATYAIIGHAERRAIGETNDEVRKKVDAALSARLTPILCIGEKSRDQSADHFNFVREQLRTGLSEDAGKKLSKIIIAYEPVWAIGATKAMEPRQMHEMTIFIRKTLVERFGEAGHSTKILYGGSVDGENAGDMMRNGDVVGLLVGRASVDIQALTGLLRACAEA